MNSVSDNICTSTGAPQGCVLSPVLFSLYSSDYRTTHPSCPIIKYADDTSLTGLISRNDDSFYRKEIDSFFKWCDFNFLELNVSKTKEMVFDFRKTKTEIEPICIHGTRVETVTDFKYLGTFIDSNLNWKTNTQRLVAKANQRMYFIRKLKSFRVCNDILFLFYQCVIQSIITSCITVWYGNLRAKDIRKLERVTKAASKTIGLDVKHIHSIFESAITSKLCAIMQEPKHPLYASVVVNRSGRIRAPCTNTKRFRMSFLPNACHLFNTAFKR